MKRCTVVFLTFNTALTLTQVVAQDLRSDWNKIQAFFLSGRHDSVVVHVQPFIAELEKRSLSSQLSVAYYHYAVSLAQLGNLSSSDSMFVRARETAQKANEPERVKEIGFKQIQLYLTLAKNAEKTSPPKSIELYSKALSLSEMNGDPLVRGTIHYQRGLVFRSMKDDRSTIRDFESALQLLQNDPNSQQVQSSIQSALTTLYLNVGESEKARALSERTGVAATRLEYTIKLAQEAEAKGDLERADGLVSSIQTDMFSSQSDDRIIEFVKKRYTLYEMRGKTAAGLDTLRSMVMALQRLGKSASCILRSQQMLALLYVQNARVQEAALVVAQMNEVLAAGGVSPELATLVDQTQADIAYLQGDNQTAISFYQKVLSRVSGLDKENHLTILNNLGLALTRNGQNEEALATFQKMYTLAGDGAPSYRVQADLNSGIILVKQDKVREAVDRLKRAKEAAEANQDVSLQIMASLRLAEAYRRSGYDNLADELFDQVRSEQSKLKNPFNRIQVLQALSIYAKGPFGSYKALADLKLAYSIAQQIGATGYLGTLAANLADTYFLVDSLVLARNYYRAALEYYGSTQDLRTNTELRFKLGQTYLAEGRFDEARREIRGALEQLLVAPRPDPAKVQISDVREADLYGQGLASLSFVNFSQGKRTGDIRRLLTSLDEVQKAVELLEARQLANLSRAQKEAESVRNVNAYRLLVDVASELYSRTGDLRYFELGFDTSEKSRAEAFVAEVGTQLITKLNDPKAREAAKITATLAAQAPQEAGLALDITQTAGATRGLVTGREDLRALERAQGEYEKIIQKLSVEDRKVAQLISVNTLNLNSLRTLLQADEVVLSYYVSIDKCYLFVITPSASRLRVIHWTPEDLSATVEGFRSAIQDYERSDYHVFGQVLYDSLIAPVEKEIAGKQLIIIPSGRLNTLPFGALSNRKKFLLEEYDLALVPNASTLQFIRSGKKLSSAPSIFALGNPNNPQVSRLPGTESEVNNIKSIFTNSTILLGDEANESFAKEKMGAFEIVHIACHGLFNYEFPLLSSLALSPDPHNDGFLQVHELYNMNLINTNLVVLSACETGLAQIKKNDDVIGLVRGFLYAGVPSMVASLWKVDDYATSILMSNFHLLLKLGNTKSQALRKAQMQVMRTENTSHPFFWAAFLLFGNPH
ncbi:MAG TPA: CHAT domain-containing tetratricopeptide repeat protein [Bacteroidota bacterium]|nr:CHAT domain-containing tetratricopeptide repeat protein [Bacteroidota bacterium]